MVSCDIIWYPMNVFKINRFSLFEEIYTWQQMHEKMFNIISMTKMQLETMIWYHFTWSDFHFHFTFTFKVKIVTIQNAGQDGEKLDLAHTSSENVKWYSHSEKQFSFLRKLHALIIKPSTCGPAHVFQ